MAGDLVLALYSGSVFLPGDAEGWVGQGVVEGLILEGRVGQGVAQGDVGDGLAFDDHVGFADGVGLGVNLLAKQVDLGLVVERLDLVVSRGEHAAGARGGVVDRADNTGGAQFLVAVEQDGDHQVDDFAGG